MTTHRPWGTKNRTPLTPKTRNQILQRDNNTCHICGHPGGKLDIDHITGYTEWVKNKYPGNPNNPQNLAPAHHTPCPTCGETCHQNKSRKQQHTGTQNTNAKTTHPKPPHPAHKP